MVNMRKIVYIIIALALLVTLPFGFGIGQASATDLKTTYELLKNDYPDYIRQLRDGGIGDEEIESFLNTLDIELDKRGTLTESNFNSVLKNALLVVMFSGKHDNVVTVLLKMFSNDIDSFQKTGQIPANLVPLKNAVKERMLGSGSGSGSDNEETGNKNNLGGNESGSSTLNDSQVDPVQSDDDEQPVADEDAISPPVQDGTGNYTNNFTDMVDHWAFEDVNRMFKLGLVTGETETKFAPNRSITRAEFTALLVRALKLNVSDSSSNRFSDVDSGSWYAWVVDAATDAGLVGGYGNGIFAPNDSITREQMAVMITRAMMHNGKTLNLTQAEVTTELAKFKDRDLLSDWACNNVAAALKQGIVGGRNDDTFAPKANATRAEAAVMVMRMCNSL